MPSRYALYRVAHGAELVELLVGEVDALVLDEDQQLVDTDRVEAEVGDDEHVRVHERGIEIEVLHDELAEVVDRHRRRGHPRMLGGRGDVVILRR